MNNPLSKTKAKSTGKQRVQSNSLLPGGHAHIASDADHEPELRAFAEGGATLERPAAVDNWVHWPELSKFLTVSDVTMSAQQSGWGLSANGKVPRVARALMASSRFMKHARAWPADLLKKKVCSRPCCRHSDWILGPSNWNNNKSSTSISHRFNANYQRYTNVISQQLQSKNKKAMLLQGEPRNATVNFDTYRILQ